MHQDTIKMDLLPSLSYIAITTIYPTMKIQAALLLSAIASSAAFAPIGSGGSAASSTQLRAEIGETGVAFENVAREWRCKVCAFDFHFLYVCACLDDVTVERDKCLHR